MRYLLKRGKGSRRRVAHLCGYDPVTGHPTMVPFCGQRLDFNLTSNVPWGQRTCKRCRSSLTLPGGEGQT